MDCTSVSKELQLCLKCGRSPPYFLIRQFSALRHILSWPSGKGYPIQKHSVSSKENQDVAKRILRKTPSSSGAVNGGKPATATICWTGVNGGLQTARDPLSTVTGEMYL